MKIMGIDFGTKRVGVAISDISGSIAFPRSVLKNDNNLLKEIVSLIEKEEVKKIVVGEPDNLEYKKNVTTFVDDLKKYGFEVLLEKEFMTSMHVDMFTKTKPIARKTKQKIEPKKDESAAALILQRYLDRK